MLESCVFFEGLFRRNDFGALVGQATVYATFEEFRV